MNKKHALNNKKIISFIPDGEFYYKKAIKAMQIERFQDAHKYLKRATELSPDDPLILMQLGVLMMEEGRFDEALEILQEAYMLDQEVPEIVFYLAEIHAHLGLLIEAKAYAEKYLKMEVAGSFQDDAEEIIDFVNQFDMADTEEDSEVFILQEKARHHMESGEFKDAVIILENIISDYPELWASYNNLALAYFYLGKIQQAYDILDDVLEKNEGNLHALCNLAVFYYYEEKNEELQQLLEMLTKFKPYLIEHRYKLSATFSLIGKHEEAFQLFHQMEKQGFDGDAGFYFWYAHSAYFTGHQAIAEKAYAKLVEIDETKAGYEPWKDIEEELHAGHVEKDRAYLLKKIQNEFSSERMFGYYLLGKSAYKQEILSHPTYIDLSRLSQEENVFLMSSLSKEFQLTFDFSKAYIRAYETTELLYRAYGPLNYEATYLFQMWFTLCEEAMRDDYAFKNPKALASAVDYMFHSSRYEEVTKKEMAGKYGISVPTLTKYVNELIAFLPFLK